MGNTLRGSTAQDGGNLSVISKSAGVEGTEKGRGLELGASGQKGE